MNVAGPPSAKGRATRRRILISAAEVMAQNGAAATTLDDVCAGADVSRGQLYHYFGNKADLVREVVGVTAEAVVGFHGDHLDRLDSIAGIAAWFDELVSTQEHRHAQGGCPIGSLIGQLAERDEEARLILTAAIDKWEHQLFDALLRMRAHGELAPNTDAAALATTTMASIQGGLILTQVRRDPTQLRTALNGAMTTLLAAASSTPAASEA